MKRHFVRTAAIVVCVAWAAGLGAASAANPAPASAAPATDQTSSGDLPATLDGEIARAHALRVKGAYEDATKALAQLMLVAPDNVRVVGEYGKVLVQEGRSPEALEFLTRAIELDANDWTLYSALGVAYDQTDDHAKAKIAYEHALSLKPGAPQVLNNYAVSRMLAGDLAGAGKLLAQASQAQSTDAKIANNLALLTSMKAAPGAGAVAQQPSVSPAQAKSPPEAEHAPALRTATAAPKALAGVVMEKVPLDPLAGPVAAHEKKLASTAHKTKTARKASQRLAEAKTHSETATSGAQQAPVLRTAADGQ